MKLCDFIGLNGKQVMNLIRQCKFTEMETATEIPREYTKKVVLFLGNYANFDSDSDMPCARYFQYLPDEKKWKVVDITLWDGFEEEYDMHFTKKQINEKFRAFYKKTGFEIQL